MVRLELLSLDEINVLATKAEGRDKMARFFQYTARMLLGAIQFSPPRVGTRLSKAEQDIKQVMMQLAAARRIHRWLKEIPVIQSIPKTLQIANPIERLLELAQKVTLATFMIIDHIGMLKQWKILPGGRRSGTGTIQLGLKFFCFSNVFAIIAQLRKFHLLGLSSANGKSTSCSNGSTNIKEVSLTRQKCLETAFKHFLLVIQVAHLSTLYQSHDMLVGLCGMVSSWMDTTAQLPEKSKAV